MENEDEKIEAIAELCLEDVSFYEDQATSLKSASFIREQTKQDIINFLESEDMPEQLLRAFTLIREEGKNFLTEQEFQDLEKDLAKINEDRMNSYLYAHDGVEEKNVTYQEVFELSDSSLSDIYKIGFEYFQNQQIDKAIDIFTLLLTLNPMIADFCYGLGLCYQHKQGWEDALLLFTLANKHNPDHIPTCISAIECCRQLGDEIGASAWLNEVDRIQQEQPESIEPWRELLDSLR